MAGSRIGGMNQGSIGPAYAGGGQAPLFNYGGIFGSGLQGLGSGFLSGLSGVLGGLGLFGNYDEPYKQAQDIYQQQMGPAMQYLQPFQQAGAGAIPQYQDYLKQLSDPSGYVNKLMGGYQQSPYAQYEQQQATRAAQNVGSASGLLGSSPLQQQAQQTARDISSQDMGNYLQNVLGVGQQYGQGLSGMMGMGAQTGGQLADIQQRIAENMAQMAYGKGAAHQQQQSDIFGGIGSMIGGLFGF